MQRDLADVGRAAVLEEINTLPSAERQPAADDRDREADIGQSGADVGRHVVGPLIVMGVEARRLGRDAVEESFEVGPHVKGGVFLDQQRRRVVAAEEGRQPGLELLRPEFARHPVGEFIEPATAGFDVKDGGELVHGLFI